LSKQFFVFFTSFLPFVLQEKNQKRLSTLRWRTVAIGAYFQKINGTTVLTIALTKKRRRWFDDLWNYPIALPLCSNASFGLNGTHVYRKGALHATPLL
jgi:hypothetical protein